MGLSSELKAEDFVPVSKDDFIPVPIPSIFERLGQFYRDVTPSVRDPLAAGLSKIFGSSQFLRDIGEGSKRMLEPSEPTPTFPRMGGGLLPSKEDWRKYSEAVEAMPKPEPSTLGKFFAGAAIPPEAWEAALQYGIAPGTSGMFRVAKESVGPVRKGLVGGVKRALTTGGATAATAALTGEDPLVAGGAGVVTSGLSDIFRGVRGHYKKDLTPITAEGYTRAQKRLSPTVNLDVPQPGNWTRALVDDLPALKPHVKEYEDLLSLKSEMSGLKITEDSTMAKRVGQEIYRSFHDLLRSVNPDARFHFPYLKPPEDVGTIRVPVDEPTIRNILPGMFSRILQDADNLTAKQALHVLHELKSVAFTGETNAIKGAARGLADQLQNDFMQQLSTLHPELPYRLKFANLQYGQLKGLQRVISKYSKELFPGGVVDATGRARSGLNPIKWGEALVEMREQMPPEEFSRFHKAVTFGGFPGSRALALERPGGDVRYYTPLFTELIRLGQTLLRVSPKMEFPTPPPSRPLSPLFRMLPPATLSGLHSLGIKPEDQPQSINRTVNPWAK